MADVVKVALLLAVMAVACGATYRGTRCPALGRSAVIHFRSQTASSIEGVVWQQHGKWLVLRRALLLDPGGAAPTPIDGDVLIDRGEVLFMQLIEPRRHAAASRKDAVHAA